MCMKKSIIKKIIILSYVLTIVLMVVSTILFNEPFLPFNFAKYILTYEYANYKINKECDDIEKENRDKNTKAAQKYIRDKYGDILSEVIKIEYIGRRKDWVANSHYILKAPFCDDGELSVDSETHNVYGGFDFEISSKFKYLYSEWVKKQVGIDDENIDIEITCTDIRFQDIEKYETADNIFECSSGRIDSIILKNAKKDASTSFKEKFMQFEKKYVERFHDINLSCAYNFTIVGNDEEIYLHYKIDEYVNEYSKECYRTRYGCEIDDELCAKVLEFLRSEESERFEKFKAIASILKINDKNSLKLFNTINEEIDRRWPREKDMDATKRQQEIERSFIYRFYEYFKYIKLMMEDKYATNIDQEFIEKYINGLKSNQVFMPKHYKYNIKKELYSIITNDGEYKEIEKIDFNEKSYKYIINEVLLTSINELKPIQMFNLSKEIIDNYYYNYYEKIGSIKKTDINKNYSRKRMRLDEKLSNKLEYRDGYLVYEKLSVTREGYRDNDYELELLELQYKSTEGMLDSYELVGKVKSRITNSFELKSGYSIYIKGADDKWKEVYKSPEKYIESSDTTVPPPEIYEKVLSKFMEYYKTDGS